MNKNQDKILKSGYQYSLKKFIRQTVILIGLTLLCGIISNALFTKDFKLFSTYINPELEDQNQFEEIDIYFLIDILDNNMAVLIDARDEELFLEGHIPGAISLPVRDFEKGFSKIKSELSLDKTIITYCIDNDCPDSEILANKLFNKGFQDIFVFKAGMEGYLKFQRDNPIIEQ